jgi:hypothetical protein
VQRPVQGFQLRHQFGCLARDPTGKLARNSLHLAGHVLEIHADVEQRVVDLVGHARGQGAERGQPIGQHQVALKLLALGHVTAEQDDGALTLKLSDQVGHVQGGAASVAAEKVNLGRRRRPATGQHLAQAFGQGFPILAFDQVEKVARSQFFGALAMKRGPGCTVGVDDAAASAHQDRLGRDLDQTDQSFVGLGRHRRNPRRGRKHPAVTPPLCPSERVASGESQQGERENRNRDCRPPHDTQQDGGRHKTPSPEERREMAWVDHFHGLHVQLPGTAERICLQANCRLTTVNS